MDPVTLTAILPLINQHLSDTKGQLGGLRDSISGAVQRKRMRSELMEHQKDVTRAISQANKIAQVNLKEITDMQASIIRKQCRLAGRTKIPENIREQGNKFYSELLLEIDGMRKKILADLRKTK